MSVSRHFAAARLLVGALAAGAPFTAARAQSPVPRDSASAHTASTAADRAARRGASVAVIDMDDVDLATVRTLSDLLASRVPGVTVRRASGGAGAGAGIWMRGPSHVEFDEHDAQFGARDPLLVVDGVRADASQRSMSLSDFAAAPSRLDDFPLEDVATVEVLRGPAAAARFGLGADRGVVVVTTRRGRGAGTRAAVHLQTGIAQSAASYAPLYGRIDQNTGAVGCTLDAAARALCVPGATLRRDPFAGESVYQSGIERTAGASVRGGALAERLGYYASGGVDDREGTYGGNGVRRATARVRLDADLLPTLAASASAGYVDAAVRLPFVGGALGDPLASVLRAHADGSPLPNDPGPLDPVPGMAMRQDLTRVTSSASLRWSPARWLSADALLGWDDARRDDGRPDEIYSGSGGATERFHVQGRGRVRTTTAAAHVVASYALLPSLDAVTTAGVERTGWRGSDSTAQAYSTPSGVGSWEARWSQSSYALLGLSLAQRFTWRERLTTNLTLRRDRITTGGPHVDLQRSAEVAWALGGRPGGIARIGADRARLRAAYGNLARPDVPVSNGPVLLGPAMPPVELRGEHTREAEVGLDAEYAGGRFRLALTGYDKRTTDSPIPLPSGGPFSPPAAAVLGLRNRGAEMELAARLLQRGAWRWDTGVTFAANRNRVETLTAGGILFLSEPPVGRGVVREGEPLGTFRYRPIVGYADRNGDGVLTGVACTVTQQASMPGCEVVMSDSVVYRGTPYPTREASLRSSLAYRSLTVSGLLDYRGGATLDNSTHSARCGGSVLNCRERNDPTALLVDQARVVARFADDAAPYLEDAGYVKLREVALSLRLPPQWARPVGSLVLTLAARNLVTWTKYTGGDPEVATSASALARNDYFSQAQPRTVVLRAEIGR